MTATQTISLSLDDKMNIVVALRERAEEAGRRMDKCELTGQADLVIFWRTHQADYTELANRIERMSRLSGEMFIADVK